MLIALRKAKLLNDWHNTYNPYMPVPVTNRGLIKLELGPKA